MTNPSDEPQSPPQDDLGAKVAMAIQQGVPQIYINGLSQGLGMSDIVTVLERNGMPVAVLNMSYTIAKTFARATAQSVAALEEMTGKDILVVQEIEELVRARSEQK